VCLCTAYVELRVLLADLPVGLIPTVVFLSVRSLLLSVVAQGFCREMSCLGLVEVSRNV
jgi:hypothetical protein